jgi:hypothetical protein
MTTNFLLNVVLVLQQTYCVLKILSKKYEKY